MSPHRPEPDETLEALAGRLHRLPPPPVPAGLEARLLAAIPSRTVARAASRPWHARRLRFRLAAAVLLATAAAALFVLRLPPPPHRPPPAVGVSRRADAVSRRADDSATLWRYEQALRDPDADPAVVLNQVGPPFEWPVAGSGPSLLTDRLAGPAQ